MATRRKTLYDVLQVSRTATQEIIDSAFDARMRIFESSNAPEVLAEKALLREAHGILSDATRRKLYHEKLREEAVRALSGGATIPPSPVPGLPRWSFPRGRNPRRSAG